MRHAEQYRSLHGSLNPSHGFSSNAGVLRNSAVFLFSGGKSPFSAFISTTAILTEGGASMEKLVESLGPAFAAGLAVQQLLEILGPILVKIKVNRKIFLGFVSLGLG